MDIVFTTAHLKLVLGDDGTWKSFQDVQNGTNYLDPGTTHHFMSGTRNGAQFVSSAVQQQPGNMLHVVFGDPSLWATVHVRRRPRYLTVELVAVSDPSVESIDFGVALTLIDNVGLNLPNCRNADYAGAFIALNIATYAECVASGSVSVLRAGADRAVELIGAKFAILGCPSHLLLKVVSDVERQNALPHPLLDGVWAKSSGIVKTSYLFIDLTAANFEDVIGYARLGGFKYIVIYDGTWNTGPGDYSVNRLSFPGGETDLRAVSTAIHQAGLKLGMHVLYMILGKNCPWVTPMPAEGFLMNPGLDLTLGADLHPGDTFIPTTSAPAGYLPPGTVANQDAQLHELRSYELRIGNEIISYDDLRLTPPFGFTLGAKSVQHFHSQGEPITNFAQYWLESSDGYFLPDLAGSLYDEMVAAIASTLETFDFDFIYPDALGEPFRVTSWPVEFLPPWYNANLLISKLYSAVTRPIFFAHEANLVRVRPWEAIIGTGYPWHVFSRANTRDYLRPEDGAPPVTTARVIQHFDDHSLPGCIYWTADLELDPIEFGWFGFYQQQPATALRPTVDATRPREVVYAWAKALAFGAAMSLETFYGNLRGNGRTAEILTLIHEWDDLRLRNYFPESVRTAMRAPGKEFTLRRASDGQWVVLPILYSDNGGIMSWTFDNPYHAQHVFISIDTGASGVSITNPMLTVNSVSVVFNLVLEPGWYLECSGEGFLRLFDGNGFSQPVLPAVALPPIADHGVNDVSLSYEGPATPVPFVTLATHGAAL